MVAMSLGKRLRSVGRVLLCRPGVTTRVLAACLLVSLLAACTSGPGAPEGDYTAQLTASRESKDKQFREEKDPVPAARKDTLLPLSYFPADESYVVPAQLRLADEQKRPIVTMPTSTGTLRRYQRVGVLEFMLQNQKFTLGA